jgi:SAM-dependent methyltransferase
MSGDSWKRRSLARWLSGSGIELGALHNPLRVPSGAEVTYVDRASTEELNRQYPDLEGIVPVSVIGDAHDLSALATNSVDFVIANHVIEHLEDPIRGLLEITRVIRPGGLLFLAIPDQRVTFDRHRPVTPIDHLVHEFRHGTAATRREHFEEYVRVARPEEDPTLGTRTAAQIASEVDDLMERDYSIHFHVYRPDTFVELLEAVKHEAGVQMEFVSFAGCDGDQDDEFIFLLGKGIDALPRRTPPLIVGEHLPAPPEPTRAQLVRILRGRVAARVRRLSR